MDNISNKQKIIRYIDQSKRFWQKDIEYHFSDKEVAFYFYLLHTSSTHDGSSVFDISNKIILAKFGWGRESFKNLKIKLKEANLIDYQSGQGRGNLDKYTIIEKSKEKRNINKKRKTYAYELILPFRSEAFVSLWNNLIQTPKWREKPINILQANLDRLKKYDEPFAIQLIEQTLLGNWQGLIFRDTDNQYEKWKMQHTNMNETNNRRREEIISRAAQAAAACNS